MEFIARHMVSLDQARQQLGGRLPECLEGISLTPTGLINDGSGALRVPWYLANGLKFHQPGAYYIDKVLIPQLVDVGCYVFEPFSASAQFLPEEVFDLTRTTANNRDLWRTFNETIGFINYQVLIPRSKGMFAVLEGYPVDEGVASEVAFMATNVGSVVGARTDFRLAENPATGTNPAVTYFLGDSFRGKYFEGQDSYEKAIQEIKFRNEILIRER